MERTPSSTIESLQKELSDLDQEIIDLEGRLQSTHDESGGNSPEDNAQEAQADLTNQAIIAERIRALREKQEALKAGISDLQSKSA